MHKQKLIVYYNFCKLKFQIWDKITNELLSSLAPSPADVETLRVYLLLPFYHEFVNSKNYEVLHTPFSKAVCGLNEIPRKIVGKWWAQMSSDWFEHLVSNFKDVVAYIISFKIPPIVGSPSQKRVSLFCNRNFKMCIKKNIHMYILQLVRFNSNLVAALKMLLFLHYVNNTERKEKVHYEIFHWPELPDFVDIQQEYLHWLFDKNVRFLRKILTKKRFLSNPYFIWKHLRRIRLIFAITRFYLMLQQRQLFYKPIKPSKCIKRCKMPQMMYDFS